MGAPEFRLVPPERPRVLAAPAPCEPMSDEIRAAMRAALKGDFAPLDRLELTHINRLARIGVLFVKHPDGTPHWWFNPDDARFERIDDSAFAPFAVGLHRGVGPAGCSAIEWQLLPKCRRCDGRLVRRDCRVCRGTWWVDDMYDHEIVLTDTDGVLIYEEDA